MIERLINSTKTHISQKHTGHQTTYKNNSSSLQRRLLGIMLSKSFPYMKRKIDRQIKTIRKRIADCDPLQLLSFASDLFLISNLNIASEFQASRECIHTSRITEYVQSVLVSTENHSQKETKDPSKKFFRIQHNIEKLFQDVDIFYFCWAANIPKLYQDFDTNTQNFLREAQYLYSVRGERYQIFESEYFEKLLGPHDDIFKQLFKMSSNDIIEGIKKLQFALSQGKMAIMNELGHAFDEYIENGKNDMKQFANANSDLGRRFAEEFLGTKLRDVIEVTGWTEEFVAALSFGLNECDSFWDGSEYAGWPIIDLPVQKRPFIRIGGKYYCFDYYSFVDNFYRAIQKAVSRKQPEYNWSEVQKEASEKMVADVFSEILPGCTIYRDNYYPKTGSLKKMFENDIIIEYLQVLIVVEVKAGSFVFTPPITDFESHIRSYKTLIEKSDHQCKNTYDYLQSKDVPNIYNGDGTFKAQIDMRNINEVYMMSVTIDNINAFAARAEKLNFLQLRSGAISLSIDDLMVYREFFDSPLVFLHFLKQRRQATKENKLALNDELDHLGMYIKHNLYCLQLQEYPEDAHLFFSGYREELDEYFCSLYHPELRPTKPSLKTSSLFCQFVDYLERASLPNKVEIADYFLSFSTDAEQQFCQSVEYALKRQVETGTMLSLGTAGDDDQSLRYTCFVHQPGIQSFSDQYKRAYTLSTLLWNKEQTRVMIELFYDENNHFDKVMFTKYSAHDIQEGERAELKAQGKARAIMRLEIYERQYGTINVDDLCPCGSGKTFGHCCKNELT